MSNISRRKFLESSATVAAAAWLGNRGALGEETIASEGMDFAVTRFMMKQDYPRLEVRAPDYRFVWHGRWFGFRLCGRPADFDERISYVSFGTFQLGGADLVCTKYLIAVKGPKGPLDLIDGRLGLPVKSDPQHPEFLLEYPERMRFYLRFSARPPHLQMTIEPLRGKEGEYYSFPLAGHGVYSDTWQGETAAAYFSPGTQTGLCVAAASPASVAVEHPNHQSILRCRLPANRPSNWALTVLKPVDWTPDRVGLEKSPPPMLQKAREAYETVQVPTLPSWEKKIMNERRWQPRRGIAKERVAGIYVTAPKWNHPCSTDPCGQIEHVEKVFLDKTIAAGVFPAIGLSRDGVYERRKEFDTHARWLKLVERIHAAGLRAYMKPGDGELSRLKGSRELLTRWADDCFAVPPAQQADVLRLCWEAVLHPWETADLCLPNLPGWFANPEELSKLAWAKVREQIVTAVADRFSFIIEQVRRHAPQTTIDLECGDSAVFEKLLSRHENLGVMYMCYGPYPRVGEYLDLYSCVAREQLRAERIVLETDCYYTDSVPSLKHLYRQSPEKMYPPADIAGMADKHRHMNGLAVNGTWAWGINICYTPEKFQQICQAEAIRS